MTDRNKWLGGALSCLIAAQLVFGIYFVVWVAARPSKFFDSYPRSRVDSRPLPARQMPAIDLDPFRFCLPQSWKFGGLLFVNIAVVFGASPTSDMVSPQVLTCFAIHVSYIVDRRRRARVLEYFDHSQETQATNVSGHPEPLGCNSAGRDDILYTHGFVSSFSRFIYFVRPGESPPMVDD